jgi:hypothetical protein
VTGQAAPKAGILYFIVMVVIVRGVVVQHSIVMVLILHKVEILLFIVTGQAAQEVAI